MKPVDQGFAFNDPCMGCVVPTLNAVVDHFYDSRDDPEWKTAQRATPMPTAVDLQRIGWWGRLYPRVGYVTHNSPLSASGLAATRAFSLARQPVDLWPVAGKVPAGRLPTPPVRADRAAGQPAGGGVPAVHEPGGAGAARMPHTPV